jgi:isopentenyl-diphosphate Delta-isomerase
MTKNISSDHSFVILVDEHDQELGLMPKMEAHKSGLLHRAVSVFMLNSEGEWLIQKRAAAKYHSAGLWSNTCCTHPFPDEPVEQAALRRVPAIYQQVQFHLKKTGEGV